MHQYESNQQFYNHIDKVVASLRLTGQIDIANQIHHLLHKVTWTSSSELFGELRERFEKVLKSPTPLPKHVEDDINGFITIINQALSRSIASSKHSVG
jgi:hypothetical protein